MFETKLFLRSFRACWKCSVSDYFKNIVIQINNFIWFFIVACLAAVFVYRIGASRLENNQDPTHTHKQKSCIGESRILCVCYSCYRCFEDFVCFSNCAILLNHQKQFILVHLHTFFSLMRTVPYTFTRSLTSIGLIWRIKRTSAIVIIFRWS